VSATFAPVPALAGGPASAHRSAWLFSAPVDLGVFLGSSLLALGVLFAGKLLGLAGGDTPDWTWVPAVLLVDVAHVYATGFRAYLDRGEFRSRRVFYSAVPVIGFAVGVVLYSQGAIVFWRALAYLAVFHFVRQQYGWVALYRRRAGETSRVGFLVDSAAIYAATLYPLIYWHAHLPRRFWWFVADDFAISLPRFVSSFLAPVYVLILSAYAAFAIYDWTTTRRASPGKHVVVATTALCWYVGIVACNSDFAFTVTNVFIHGIPYLALVFWFARSRATSPEAGGLLRALISRGPVAFLGVLWLCAYAEEVLWDRAVWHDRAWLFGSPWHLDSLQIWVVPLLAVPQLTHYVLDGFLWRRRDMSGGTTLAA